MRALQRPSAREVSKCLRIFNQLAESNNMEFVAPVISATKESDFTDCERTKRLQEFRDIISNEDSWEYIEELNGLHFFTKSINDKTDTIELKIARAYVDVHAHAQEVSVFCSNFGGTYML